MYGAAQAQTPTATPTPEKDDEVVRISTTLIQIDVTVTDRSGRVVRDLKAGDFEIYEDGKRQELTVFSFVPNTRRREAAKPSAGTDEFTPPPQSLRSSQVRSAIALVVDDLSLSFESTAQVRKALKKFVDEQMQEGDLVAIVRTGGGVGALQQFTTDKRILYAAIERVKWNALGTGRVGAFTALDSTIIDQELEDLNPGENPNQAEIELNNNRDALFANGTLGALNYVIRGMGGLPGRKSVMLFSDGFRTVIEDRDGFIDEAGVRDSLRSLTDLANRSSVVIYAADARGMVFTGLTAADSTAGRNAERVSRDLAARRNQILETQDGLSYLARETGGVAFLNSNDLSSGVDTMLEDQSYYLIGYQPEAETFDASKRAFNRLEVRVNRDDLQVRYRSGFYGVSDEQAADGGTSAANGNSLLGALTSPFAVNDVALNLNALFLHRKEGSFVRSLLHIDASGLTFKESQSSKKQAVFEVLAMSFGDNGVPVEQSAQRYSITVGDADIEKLRKDGFVYQFTFPVKKPGAYQYRVAIRDVNSGKVGSASQFVEVPRMNANELALSGLVLENLSATQWSELNRNNTEVAGDAVSSTALPKFKRGSVLRYGFEIYNPKLEGGRANVSSSIRIFHNGQAALRGRLTPVEPGQGSDNRLLKASGAISLATDMEPGDYVLQVIVVDNNKSGKKRAKTAFVQFEVTP